MALGENGLDFSENRQSKTVFIQKCWNCYCYGVENHVGVRVCVFVGYSGQNMLI